MSCSLLALINSNHILIWTWVWTQASEDVGGNSILLSQTQAAGYFYCLLRSCWSWIIERIVHNIFLSHTIFIHGFNILEYAWCLRQSVPLSQHIVLVCIDTSCSSLVVGLVLPPSRSWSSLGLKLGNLDSNYHWGVTYMFNFYLLDRSFVKKTTIFCLQVAWNRALNIQRPLSNISSALAAFEGWNYKSSFCKSVFGNCSSALNNNRRADLDLCCIFLNSSLC